MGGFFGVISKSDCVFDLFFGTDYHSHLGTKRAGMVVYGENGFERAIHNIENSPFRTKFERDVEQMAGNSGIGCISDTEPQPLIVRSHLGNFAITTVGRINNIDALVKEASEKLVASERYELFAQAEGMLIDGGYIIPWESGGGTYGMTREIPFTAPRGGFGLSRFKYKGMQLSEEPISAEQYKQLEDEFYEQLLKRNAG